ncbi:MAG: response regulator [Armatimonadetes bacterium]|nr:response regulator [Armatimonadota bacterium]
MSAPDRKRILFIDDEEQITSALESRLHRYRDQWELVFLNNSQEAVAYAAEHDLDTVITDIRMPGLDGYGVVARLREMPRHVSTPIIVLTGNAEADQKRRALDAGADDLLNKPVLTEDLVARLQSALRIKEQQDQLRDANRLLEARVDERTRELANSRLDIILRLARAAEYRDEDTGFHIVRVGLYAKVLAEGLGLPPDLADQLILAAPLHDVGKIGVPDSILLARRRLTEDEWVIMRAHASIGHGILTEASPIMAAFATARGQTGEPPDRNPLIQCAASIALTHHEKFDGSGYPRGLSGEAIPIEGRIAALADVFDALSSERPYKPAFPESQVLDILRAGCGSHFDPGVYAAFERVADTFRQIRAHYTDAAPDGERIDC